MERSEYFEALLQGNSGQKRHCEQSALHILNNKIVSKFGSTKSADLIWKSDTSVEVEKDSAEKLFKLLNALEDNDDVQGVSSNFEVSEETLASLT